MQFSRITLTDDECLRVGHEYMRLPPEMQEHVKAVGKAIAEGSDAPRAAMARLLLAEIGRLEAT